MYWKNLIILAIAMFSTASASAATLTLPEFSTTDDPAYYYVQFITGDCCIADQGAGNNLKLATQANEDAQKWQFIGDENSFKMRSKSGNYVGFSNSFFTTVADESSAVDLAISVVNSKYEIGRKGVSNHMNQWSGARAGNNIGEYYPGDTNNGLTFVASFPQMPVFSTAEMTDDDVWYVMQFCRGTTVIQSYGIGVNAKQANLARQDEQLWKFVGDKSNFQLINKLGQYGTMLNSYLSVSETEYSSGFALEQSVYSGYPLAWSIKDNSSGRYFNAWAGATVGHYIGLYGANDIGAPLYFKNIDTITFPDSGYTVAGADSFTPPSMLTLWYTQPATLTNSSNQWMEYSLPIGNGQLGACLYGGVIDEEIQFNEKTLWTGGPNDRGSYGTYKNFGSIHVANYGSDIGYLSTNGVKDYVRYLDIERGVAGVQFSNAAGTTNYDRQYFSSNPDQVIVAHYTSTGDDKVSLCFTATPSDGINASDPEYSDGYCVYSGKLTTVSYNATFRVVPIGEDAVMTTSSNGVLVRNADEVLLILAAGTDFDASVDTYVSGTSELAATMKSRVDLAADKTWQQLLDAHVADFTSYMGRVHFNLDGAASSLPTDQLVQNYNNTSNNVTGMEPEVLFLEQLYFAYGRYLEISSSRGGDVPSNLQGIWNNSNSPSWNGDIHSNINVQMNYWPAESTNLSEMHMPFLNYIIRNAASTNWHTAATTWGKVTDGWTCLTENNIFGGMSTWGSNYLVANAWYCSHLWQHYRYTLDTEFLQRAFPAMWSCAQFWMERMIEDRNVQDGTYVCPNEYSPEQNDHSSEDGTAHAQQLVSYLLDSVKESVDILGKEACNLSDDDLAKLDKYVANVDRGLHTEVFKGDTWEAWGTQNGIAVGDTLLREWKVASYDVSSDKGHRHMSHLMALFPLDQIDGASPYFKAAVNSLKLRGDEATGWSMGWKVNLWARAMDGNHAHTILHNALKHSTSYSTNQYAGGIYYNLFDSHAPFQIDGNFGVCSGVAEMIMQSHSNMVMLLPALPSVWKKGSMTGLKAQGDFTVDVEWENGKITNSKIVSNKGATLTISDANLYHCHIYRNGSETDTKVYSAKTASTPIETRPGDVITVVYDPDYTNDIDHTKVGVEIVSENKAGLDIADRTITVSGFDIADVKVYDLQGRHVLTTSDATFTVPDTAGPIVMLSITDIDGTTETHKLELK
jgi:alpha-L-fucosidase 2